MSKLYKFPACAGASMGQAEFFNHSGVTGMLDTVLEGCVESDQTLTSPLRPSTHPCVPDLARCAPVPAPSPHVSKFVHEIALSRRYSATVLAYGQTGSGKTHTMSGYEDSEGECGCRRSALDGCRR